MIQQMCGKDEALATFADCAGRTLTSYAAREQVITQQDSGVTCRAEHGKSQSSIWCILQELHVHAMSQAGASYLDIDGQLA